MAIDIRYFGIVLLTYPIAVNSIGRCTDIVNPQLTFSASLTAMVFLASVMPLVWVQALEAMDERDDELQEVRAAASAKIAALQAELHNALVANGQQHISYHHIVITEYPVITAY